MSTAIVSQNSSTAPLSGGETFTGEWVDVARFEATTIAIKTDQDGTLYADFSPDGTNTDSTLTYQISASVNEVHRLTVTRRYMRVRYTNGSQAQTYLRLQTMIGEYAALSSPLNSTIQQDADATVVRTITEEITIAQGLLVGVSNVNIFGFNPDIDTGAAEDIWGGGGTYTGFPDGSAEAVEVFSSDANDTAAGSGARTIRLTGLDANWAAQTADVTLNGVTPVQASGTWRRVHKCEVRTSGPSNLTFNAGALTVRHAVTTANVFSVMPAGRNQSGVCGYTVPAGYRAFVRSFQVFLDRSTSATASGAIYLRRFGMSPQLIDSFSLSNTAQINESIYGGIEVPEKSDVTVRISSVSANNTPVYAHVDLVQIKT